MFAHNKRLQYTVRVGSSNPGLANLMLEQFGGPQGELAAAYRYFTQALAEDDPGRKDRLMDIATEELSHLEVIGTIVAMLNKGAKGRLSEAAESEAELYRSITGNGNSSHVTQVLYDGDARGPWNAAENFEFVTGADAQQSVDGDGKAAVALTETEKDVLEQLVVRTASDPESDPLTGAELGMGLEEGETEPQRQ